MKTIGWKKGQVHDIPTHPGMNLARTEPPQTESFA